MTIKKLLSIPLWLLLGYGLLMSRDFTEIAAGIAIFIVGMLFMEEGFKLFTGGLLSKILAKTTNTVPKAIFSGFLATAIVQSSSLTSVIAISFVSAELIQLSQAIGIIFGANIGTTTTAWIVATFGLKVNISSLALPMLVFGVALNFFKSKSGKGLGRVLLGLGFIFLGIAYLKDGFTTLQQGIDLARFAVPGLLGVAVYVVIGAVATVIIQSSSATMALIITAVATGQIDYQNSMALAIGANIGTTVTAILGALTSNANGKRLAVAHFIFNTVTAVAAIALLGVLGDIVDRLSVVLHIDADDIAMKLSLFHTIFNVLGVVLVTPFIKPMVRFLETLFVYTGERRGQPMYLDEEVVKTAGPAVAALAKECMHLYDVASHIIIEALWLRKEDVFSSADLRRALERLTTRQVDIDALYQERIKNLYGAIIHFAVQAEPNMTQVQRKKVYKLKLACREIVEAIKDIRELQKNIARYMRSDNQAIRDEYNFLRENLVNTLRRIEDIRNNPNDYDAYGQLVLAREHNRTLDAIGTQRLSGLLLEGMISQAMASSLMNDSDYTRMIAKNLLKSAAILYAGEAEREVSPDTPEMAPPPSSEPSEKTTT